MRSRMRLVGRCVPWLLWWLPDRPAPPAYADGDTCCGVKESTQPGNDIPVQWQPHRSCVTVSGFLGLSWQQSWRGRTADALRCRLSGSAEGLPGSMPLTDRDMLAECRPSQTAECCRPAVANALVSMVPVRQYDCAMPHYNADAKPAVLFIMHRQCRASAYGRNAYPFWVRAVGSHW
jgi:hypothetical protein